MLQSLNIAMPISRMKPVLLHAQANQYAVPAFNVCNLEYAQVVIKTADRMRSPVIVAMHPVEIAYGGLREMAAIVKGLSKDTDVPVVLHLDHGGTLQDVEACITQGFSSVMIDASKQLLKDNIKITSEVVRLAHSAGVDVEAELGLVGGTEGDQYSQQNSTPDDGLTDPLQVKEFVEKTGVDSLAIAIGTAHGFYRGIPYIDLEKLRDIRKTTAIPLVLHGGSGVGDNILQEAVRWGISKINIATELKYAFHQGILNAIQKTPEEFEPRTIIPCGMQAAEELVEKKMRLFCSAGKVV